MNKAKGSKKINRSAATGKLVTKKFAEENPGTTVKETVNSKPKFSVKFNIDNITGNLHNTSFHFREVLSKDDTLPMCFSLTIANTKAINGYKEGETYLVQIAKQ